MSPDFLKSLILRVILKVRIIKNQNYTASSKAIPSFRRKPKFGESETLVFFTLNQRGGYQFDYVF